MSNPIALLRDDFTNNTIDPCWSSSVVGSATVAETGGQAVLTLPNAIAGSHSAIYRSTALYDLTGDGFVWNIATMVATGVAATAYCQLLTSDLSQQLYWRQLSNSITARTIVAGVDTALFTATWSSSTYKYLRIRESGGTIFFDSSTNGTSWTNRASVANPFVVTSLYVQIAATCGNIASPGSFKLDDVNQILPAPSSTWRETTADWSISNRLRPVTLAASSNAQGVLVTADTMDETTRALGGTVRYFAGPLGAASGGYLALTEYASLALAEASAFPIPLVGRVDLPALVDARYMRLYHRSTDASSHTLREFVPRRIVQAEDVEAESISALNISAGAVTADKISVVSLSAISANVGTLTAGTIDGVTIYAGSSQEVTLNTNGISLKLSSSYVAQSAVKFNDSIGTFVGSLHAIGVAGGHALHLKTESVAGENSSAYIEAVAPTTKIALTELFSQSGAVQAILQVQAQDTATPTQTMTFTGTASINGGINVGTATGAGVGEVASSGGLFPTVTDAGTNTAANMVIFTRRSTATPAASFAADVVVNMHSSTNTDRAAFLIRTLWATATDASRKARANFFVYDTTSRLALQMEANGSAAMIGFLGAAAVVRPTVSGAKGGNLALGSLMTALASLGLVTDSTTA